MRTLLTYFLKHKKVVSLGIALQLATFIFYLLLAFSLEETGVLENFDVLFELDPPRAIADFADFSGDHYRTTVHPIYVLLANPGGSLLDLILNSKVSAALIANAFWGSLGVLLAYTFFYIYGGRLLNSCLLALVFGVSMSQLFLSSTPDTASLAVCSLLFTYILFLKGVREKQFPFDWWVLSGILTLGVTITNFAQTAICFTLLVLIIDGPRKGLFQMAVKVVKYGLSVLVLTGLLALLQKAIYPSSSLFFLPNSLLEEKDFTTFLVFDAPFLVITQELKHFFLVNFVAPLSETYNMPNQDIPAVTFSNSWKYLKIGWIGLGLWVSMLIAGLAKSWKSEKMQPFFIGIVACILFNAALHSAYGGGEKEGVVEYFLYSGNFTFLVLSFLSPFSQSRAKWSLLLIVVLAALMGINNYLVFEQIVGIYN